MRPAGALLNPFPSLYGGWNNKALQTYDFA